MDLRDAFPKLFPFSKGEWQAVSVVEEGLHSALSHLLAEEWEKVGGTRKTYQFVTKAGVYAKGVVRAKGPMLMRLMPGAKEESRIVGADDIRKYMEEEAEKAGLASEFEWPDAKKTDQEWSQERSKEESAPKLEGLPKLEQHEWDDVEAKNEKLGGMLSSLITQAREVKARRARWSEDRIKQASEQDAAVQYGQTGKGTREKLKSMVVGPS